MNPYRIMLADDHSMVRKGIKGLLQELTDIEVIGEARDGLELLELLKNAKPDLIILDITMPHMTGIEAANKIKERFGDIKIIILSMHDIKEVLQLAIAAGVDGYIVKADADAELIKAIKAIRAGKKYISPLISQELTSLCFAKIQGDWEAQLRPLSNREREVIQLIAKGKTNQEIADALFISIRTIQRHRYNIMKKLGFKKSVELVKYAITQRHLA